MDSRSDGPTTMENIPTSTDAKKSEFQAAVLEWAKSNTRRFPWRNRCRSAYEILVAEVLLKRTTASAVVRIYDAFLEKYPCIGVLAQATEEELTRDFYAVGLYKQRAKAVARLARHIIDLHGGSTPNTLSNLSRVPGLGSYSARAVLSFGFGEPAAVVDANVVRVLERVFQRDMPDRPTLGFLQRLADSLLPKIQHREFNFALLDLGSLVCRYVKPNCNVCPLVDLCDHANLPEKSIEAKKSYASRVRQARKNNNLTLVKLAQKAMVSKLTIINIEAGRTNPRPETMMKLAEALGVPVTNLTGSAESASF